MKFGSLSVVLLTLVSSSSAHGGEFRSTDEVENFSQPTDLVLGSYSNRETFLPECTAKAADVRVRMALRASQLGANPELVRAIPAVDTLTTYHRDNESSCSYSSTSVHCEVDVSVADPAFKTTLVRASDRFVTLRGAQTQCDAWESENNLRPNLLWQQKIVGHEEGGIFYTYNCRVRAVLLDRR